MTANQADTLAQLNAILQPLTDQHTFTNQHSVYVFGTDGCHLCCQAKQWLSYVLATQHTPVMLSEYDIINLPSSQMSVVASHIPIIVYQERVLTYPFGIMDIVALFDTPRFDTPSLRL